MTTLGEILILVFLSSVGARSLSDSPNLEVDSRIVGGKEVIRHSRPYQGGLYIPKVNRTAFCGASLINSRTVLTAAHCVDDRIGNVTLHFGGHEMPPLPEDQNVVTAVSGDVVVHPLWVRDADLQHDVAIIRLAAESAVSFTANITPVLLPRDVTQSYLGTRAVVTGWGRPSDDVMVISSVLQEMTSTVISNYACALAYPGYIDDCHICVAGEVGRNPCNGDSGGALVVNGEQIGVVSFGSPLYNWECSAGWPTAYARVTCYLDWIAQNQVNVTSSPTL